jgi:hypothetical protein
MKRTNEQSDDEVAARVRFSRAMGLRGMNVIPIPLLDEYIALEMAVEGSGIAAVKRDLAALPLAHQGATFRRCVEEEGYQPLKRII